MFKQSVYFYVFSIDKMFEKLPIELVREIRGFIGWKTLGQVLVDKIPYPLRFHIREFNRRWSHLPTPPGGGKSAVSLLRGDTNDDFKACMKNTIDMYRKYTSLNLLECGIV